MHLLEGCDARYALPTCCLRRLKDPSHSTTQHRKPDVRQTIFNKYFKRISLMTFLRQKTLRLGKMSDVFTSKNTQRVKMVSAVFGNSAVFFVSLNHLSFSR